MSSESSSGPRGFRGLARRVPGFRDARLAEVLLQRGLVALDRLRDLQERVDRGEFPGSLGAALLAEGLLDREELRRIEVALPAAELGDRGRHDPEGGTPFGKFLVHEEIGRGGMGTVHRAWQPDLGRWVALKRLKGEALAGRARFVREGRLAAQVSHPNLIPIYEVGEIENVPYIAMALISGGSLEGARLPIGRALEIIRLTAGAVQELHAAGIIHRDIKPGNLMVDDRGRVFLGDFSLAREEQTSSGLTRPGLLLGTPAFAPPEQLRGESDLIGPASDVYSLGATLYALLAGQAPFAGKNAWEAAQNAVAHPPPPIRRDRPDVNHQIQTIVDRAMRKKPKDRYPTAAALSEDIRRYLNGETILARPPSPGERLAAFLRRHRAYAGIAAVLLVAGATLAGTILVQNAKAQRTAERLELLWRSESAAQDILEWAEVRCQARLPAPPEEILARRRALDTTLREVEARREGPLLAQAIRARFDYLVGDPEAFDGLPEDPLVVFQRARAGLARYLGTLPTPQLTIEGMGRTSMTVVDGAAPFSSERDRVLRDLRSVGAHFPGPDAPEAELLSSGCEAFVSGDLARAVELLKRATDRSETRREALRLLGYVHLLRNDYDAAAEAWAKAGEGRLLRIDLAVHLALVHALQGSRGSGPELMEAALRELDQVVDRAPDWSTAVSCRGMTRLLRTLRFGGPPSACRAGYELAATDFERAARLDPNDLHHIVNRGVALASISTAVEAEGGDPRHRLEEAVALLERVETPAGSPFRYAARHHLAVWRLALAQGILLHGREGNPAPLLEASISDFGDALGCRPADPTQDLLHRGIAARMLADLRLARERRLDADLWSRARADFAAAVQRSPDDPKVRFAVARDLLSHAKASGDHTVLDEALAHATRAVEVDPANVEARRIRGIVYLELGGTRSAAAEMLRRALADLTAVLDQRRSSVDAFVDRASAAACLAQATKTPSGFDEALADLAAAEKIDPRHPRIHLQAARINLVLGRPEEAGRCLEKARESGAAEADLESIRRPLEGR